MLKLSIPKDEAIQHLTELLNGQEWHEFKKIVEENDIVRLKAETDKELFKDLGHIGPERMAAIAGLRYRVNSMEEMLRMPEKLIALMELETVNASHDGMDDDEI